MWVVALYSLSKTSLKAVFHYNKNVKPSILLGYVGHIKETYNKKNICWHVFNYDQHKWKICGDLKIVLVIGF